MQRIRIVFLAVVLATLAPLAAGEGAYADAWGPAVGSDAPPIEAPDQAGRERTLDDLARANGLLILFNRSADW
jgi:hypothetical protein